MQYDIIGDIHGEYDALVELLEKLEYRCIAGLWQHSSRQAIFLGDFIDRGLKQREVLELVMPMVEHGKALAVMGNHEFNALAFHTASAKNQWLRPRSNKNIKQHLAFLNDYLHDEQALTRVLAFFRTLPLWLDFGGLRVVHACWHAASLKIIEDSCPDGLITEAFLHAASTDGTPEYSALETVLKGVEIELPRGQTVTDKEGNTRDHIRINWWSSHARTYRDAYVGPESGRDSIPDDALSAGYTNDYGEHEPPVFIGHYWLHGTPCVLAKNIACLDYSVARADGKLVAYRWSGEQVLKDASFVWVER